MPDKPPQSSRLSQNPSGSPRPRSCEKAASDQAIAELERMMKLRLAGDAGPQAKPDSTPRRRRGPFFPRSDAAKQAREDILSIERADQQGGEASPEQEDGWLYVDLEDRLSPADRVFSRAQAGLHLVLRILAGVLTVIAGCELAYAINLLAFEGGRIGALLAAVVACFAAARWITRE